MLIRPRNDHTYCAQSLVADFDKAERLFVPLVNSQPVFLDAIYWQICLYPTVSLKYFKGGQFGELTGSYGVADSPIQWSTDGFLVAPPMIHMISDISLTIIES